MGRPRQNETPISPYQGGDSTDNYKKGVSMEEFQELYCHNCGHYVQFKMDMSLNGNHVLNCPNCGHEHCRVVKDGRITDDRWDSRNQSYYIMATSTTTSSTWDTYSIVSSDASTTGSTFLYQSWGTAVTVS